VKTTLLMIYIDNSGNNVLHVFSLLFWSNQSSDDEWSNFLSDVEILGTDFPI